MLRRFGEIVRNWMLLLVKISRRVSIYYRHLAIREMIIISFSNGFLNEHVNL